MIKGLWDSGAGMIARSLQHDVTANNLANVNTTAFKQDRLNFREMINSRLLLDRVRGASSPESMLREGMETRFHQGELQQTGNSLDFALNGDGFFVVNTADGQRYTRQGHFQVSVDGQLITMAGDPVMGQGGAITLNPGPVDASSDGRLFQEGEEVGQLQLVQFGEQENRLLKMGSGLFVPDDEDEVLPQQDTSTRVVQGQLEGSNSGAVEQMVHLIEQERMYTFTQQALSLQDENLGRAVGDLGRLT